MPTNSNSADSILELKGQLKPAPKMRESLSMTRPYVVFLDIEGQEGSKAIVLESESIVNFVEPTRNPDGSYEKVDLKALADAPCYLKSQSSGFVRMSIIDAHNANSDISFSYTFTLHHGY
ncbi:MAG: hypothetical protein ACK4NY_18525 [Spirosomataceae bacterium]